jgi:hypothetical protein
MFKCGETNNAWLKIVEKVDQEKREVDTDSQVFFRFTNCLHVEIMLLSNLFVLFRAF